MFHAVYIVVLVLEEKGRRRLLGKMVLHISLESEAVFCNHKVTRVDRYGEIRSATHVISCVHMGVDALFKMNARSCYKVTARREADNPNLPQVDMPLRSMKPGEADRPLCVV